MQPLKILFTGMVGAGKSTAIATLSEIPTAKTEVANTDLARFTKEHTTVAMDYGECRLESGETLLLYGTPGQDRFDFMWKILARGATGIIVLVDNSRPEPLADLTIYLDAFSESAARGAMVIGVGRTETSPVPSLGRFHELLMRRGQTAHVLRVDVRKRSDVLMLIEALLAQAEVRAQ
jgi:signal recognition particle receptor subunit beta